MKIKKLIENLYGEEIVEIKDEHIFTEYLLAERLTREVELIKQKKLNKKDLYAAYDSLIMDVLKGSIKHSKTININKRKMDKMFNVYACQKGVLLSDSGVVIGDFALAKFLWAIDLRVLKNFFEKNKNMAMSFLIDLSTSNELGYFVKINGNYLFENILKDSPDDAIMVNDEFGFSLLMEMNELTHMKYLAKKINTDSLNKLLDNGSKEEGSCRRQEYNATHSLNKIISIYNSEDFGCYFSERNRSYSGFVDLNEYGTNLNQISANSDFTELKNLKRKPFFVQLPNKYQNYKTLVNNYENLHHLAKKMKKTDYQLVLLIENKENIRSNEAVVLENKVLDHLSRCIKKSKGSFFIYDILKLLKKVLFKTFLGISILTKSFKEKKDKTEKDFDSKIIQLNLDGKLKKDYLKMLEKIPVIYFEKIELFLKEYPEYKERGTGGITEEGMEVFELNYLF